MRLKLEKITKLSEETQRDIAQAHENLKKGRVYTLEQVKKAAKIK